MARKKHDMVNEVLAHFDFEKVKQTMDALDWTWRGSNETPTIQELKEEAERLLNNAIDQVLSPKNEERPEVGWIAATGGFKAMAWKTKKGKLAKVQLEFIVVDWDADND